MAVQQRNAKITGQTTDIRSSSLGMRQPDAACNGLKSTPVAPFAPGRGCDILREKWLLR
jgi:hypothetical protein